MVRSFNGKESSKSRAGLTKRAPDVWDSAAFSSIFLASAFSCSQTLSTPAHTQVTQTVGTPLAQQGKNHSSKQFVFSTVLSVKQDKEIQL